MDAFINSFLLVFAGEMGDKTQLLALMLVARYRKPWTILSGVFIATILNHALASWVGTFVSTLFSAEVLTYILAGTFLFFAAWVLVPDKETDIKEASHVGAFATTVITFFIAEMGDKTQLATVALGATYANAWIVTMGTTLGMVASNSLAIFMGSKLLARVPMKFVRMAASFLFVVFGLAVLFLR